MIHQQFHVLFRSEGKMEQEVNRPIGCGEERVNRKAMISIYWSISIPTLTYGHEV